jgi:hypothetical protein
MANLESITLKLTYSNVRRLIKALKAYNDTPSSKKAYFTERRSLVNLEDYLTEIVAERKQKHKLATKGTKAPLKAAPAPVPVVPLEAA